MTKILSYEKFIIYGCMGWCCEIVFTALSEPTIQLKGWTYLWMFPIWATGAFVIEWLYSGMMKFGPGVPMWSRAMMYMYTIFGLELAAGLALLYTTGQIPWDYSYAEWSYFRGAIRLDYAPVWAGVGLLAEQLFKYVNKRIGVT